MRRKLLILLGGAFLGAALFAERIGLDNDAGWGKGRIILFISGAIIIGIALYSNTKSFENLFSKVHFIASQICEHPSIKPFVKIISSYWLVIPILILVGLFYTWFASSGKWHQWESPTYYYANLAEGFLHGRLDLPIKPDPKLMALSNPYDPLARKNIPAPLDLSLFNNHFYIYWGPVPAIILAALHFLFRGQVGDLFLTYAFVCGIFVS